MSSRKKHTYVFNETVGPKNTDHTIPYLIHHIMGIPYTHIFLDNAGSTNKNCYMMSAAMEHVQQQILD